MVIRVGKNGVITVKSAKIISSKRIGVAKPEEMYEIIRWMILDAGLVFTEEISRDVEKILANLGKL